jgi:hypothetical protein
MNVTTQNCLLQNKTLLKILILWSGELLLEHAPSTSVASTWLLELQPTATQELVVAADLS